MMSDETRISDGNYFLHPEGSCWILAQYYEGKYCGGTEQACAETHMAGNDQLAGIVPSDDDEEMDADVAEAIIRDVMGYDTYLDMVVVTRQAIH